MHAYATTEFISSTTNPSTTMTSITIPTKILAAAVSMAAKKDVRYYLNTVLIELAKDGTTFVVSSDGHALFAARLPHQHTEQPRTLMIPRDVAEAAAKTRADYVTLHIADTGTDHSLTTGAVEHEFTQGDGRFPDWRSVIPAGDPTGAGAHLDARLSYAAAMAVDLAEGHPKKMQGWSGRWDWRGPDNAAVYVGASGENIAVVMPIRSRALHKATPFEF